MTRFIRLVTNIFVDIVSDFLTVKTFLNVGFVVKKQKTKTVSVMTAIMVTTMIKRCYLCGQETENMEIEPITNEVHGICHECEFEKNAYPCYYCGKPCFDGICQDCKA